MSSEIAALLLANMNRKLAKFSNLLLITKPTLGDHFKQIIGQIEKEQAVILFVFYIV